MKTSEIYKWFKDSGFQTEWDACFNLSSTIEFEVKDNE